MRLKYKNTPSIDLEEYSHLLTSADDNKINWLERDYKSILKDITEKSILDLGCGFGSEFILMLKKKGYNPKLMIHLDADYWVFKRKQRMGGFISSKRKRLFYNWDNDSKIICDAQDIPLEDRCMDMVHQSCLFADNDIIDREKVIREIRRILKPRGLYIVKDDFLIMDDKVEIIGFKRLNTPTTWYTVYSKRGYQ